MDNFSNISKKINILDEVSDSFLKEKTKDLPSDIAMLVKKTIFEYDMKSFRNDTRKSNSDYDFEKDIDLYFTNRNLLISELCEKFSKK
jgi:hypothetical protein